MEGRLGRLKVDVRFHEGSRRFDDPARARVAGVRDPDCISGDGRLCFVKNTVDTMNVPVFCSIACVANIVGLRRRRSVLWFAP
jgi:hypothetical protein